MTNPAPPRWAAWLAGRSVPYPDADTLLGDLQERFAARARSRGLRHARRWYWGQAIGLAFFLAPHRVASGARGLLAPGTVRLSIRSLLRTPLVSLAVVGTFALAIAAPTALFGVLTGTVSSLPGDPEDRVVSVRLVAPETGRPTAVPWSVFEEWNARVAEQGAQLTALAAWRGDTRVAVGGGNRHASRYRGLYGTPGVFEILAVTPVIGRVFTDADIEDGTESILIRADVWEERFDRDPGVLGRTLRVAGVQRTIIGVLPEDFGFPNDYQLWMEAPTTSDERWSILGRLGPSASAAGAVQQLTAWTSSGGVTDAAGELPALVTVQPYTVEYFGPGSGSENFRVLARMSILLVIISAASVASIMLARGISRIKDTTLRLAIGGSRSQVMVGLVYEVLVLALAGSALGLLVGYGGVQAIVRNLTANAAVVPYWMDFGLGPRSFLQAGSLCLLSVIIAGGIPAVRSSKVNLDSALRSTADASPQGPMRLMKTLVGVEVALACALLMASTITVQQIRGSLNRGIEFEAAGVMTGRLDLGAYDYPSSEERRRFVTRFTDELRSHPAVVSSSLTTSLPGTEGAPLRVGLPEAVEDVSLAPRAQVRAVTPGFFPMFGLDASSGRLLAESDGPADGVVAVVNEAFVRERTAGLDPLGLQLEIAGIGDSVSTATIVGVVDDAGVTPHTEGREAPGVYLALPQLPSSGFYVASVVGGGASAMEAWNQVLAAIDPDQPVGQVSTLVDALSRAQNFPQLVMGLVVTFGVLALVLSLVGLHGVHALLMEKRIRAIGIRRALGARTRRVFLENLIRGLRPVWVGLLLGSVAGVGLSRVIVGNALGVQENPLLSYVLAPILVVVVSGMSIWAPTVSACRTDPAVVLRQE